MNKRIKTGNDKFTLSQKYFKRDGRAPIPNNIVTSSVMSANKAKNTIPEVLLRKSLWSKGIKGYRLHWKKVPGKPDIAFPQKRVAIFVNGCYWHRCPTCKLPIPKSNSFFWKEKFDRNIERDKIKINLLMEAEWKTMVIWECELKNDLDACIKKVKAVLI